MESIVQLITVLIIFAFVLAITYFTTMWIGNYQKARNRGVNIELLDAQRLNQSQYIQMIRIGGRYFAVAVSKDNVSLICELSADEIGAMDTDGAMQPLPGSESFKKLLERAKEKLPNKKDSK